VFAHFLVEIKDKKNEIVVNLSFSDCINFGAIMNKFSDGEKKNQTKTHIFSARKSVSVFNTALMGKQVCLNSIFMKS
jgi:hypothetical protein